MLLVTSVRLVRAIAASAVGDAPPRAQHGMGTGQFVGRSPDVRAGVVENEVVEVDERTLEPQTGAGVGEVSSGDKAGREGVGATL